MISREPTLAQVRSVIPVSLPNGWAKGRTGLIKREGLKGVFNLVRETRVVELGSGSTLVLRAHGGKGETYSELDGDTLSFLSQETSGTPRLPTVSQTPIAFTVISFPVPRASRTLV